MGSLIAANGPISIPNTRTHRSVTNITMKELEQKKSTGKKNPNLINTDVLRLLGYRVTSNGYENTNHKMRIMQLERIDDGTTPPFAYCMHPDKDVGFILEKPFAFYEEMVCRRAGGEVTT